MGRRFTRRQFLAAGVIASGGNLVLSTAFAEQAKLNFTHLPLALEQLEQRCAGRLGVAVIDAGSGETTGYKADERFAMCSTFKAMLAAAVLQRVDAGGERLDRAVTIPSEPLLAHSPVTADHAGATMSISALCAAAMTQSDNTAANLLLATLGGPGQITSFARSIGDPITRLDRNEPTLNEARPGDPRDTTSPLAIARDLRGILLGDVLSLSSRAQLTEWMLSNVTGAACLRAGVPKGWRVGDKTGSGEENTRNDVGILWPVGRAPLIVTAYLTECAGPDARRNAVLAEVGRLVAGPALRS